MGIAGIVGRSVDGVQVSARQADEAAEASGVLGRLGGRASSAQSRAANAWMGIPNRVGSALETVGRLATFGVLTGTLGAIAGIVVLMWAYEKWAA